MFKNEIYEKYKKSKYYHKGIDSYLEFLKEYEKEYISLFPELKDIKVDLIHVLYIVHYLSVIGQHDPDIVSDLNEKVTEEQKVLWKACQKSYNMGLMSLEDIIKTTLLNELKKA